MKHCKKTESQLIDYIEHNLSTVQHEDLSHHINNCEHCKDTILEYEALFKIIDYKNHDTPSAKAKEDFSTMLLNEIEISNTKSNKMTWFTFSKIAAMLVLMIGSYWLGNNKNTASHQKALTVLEQNNNELKQMMTLSLFENESASKRIQAVNYVEELDQPGEDILKALIDEMLYGDLVNVRLASANALERFSKHELVKDSFIKALKTEQNASMQIELIQILVHIKEKRAIPKMQDLLNDTNTPKYLKEQLKIELQSII